MWCRAQWCTLILKVPNYFLKYFSSDSNLEKAWLWFDFEFLFRICSSLLILIRKLGILLLKLLWPTVKKNVLVIKKYFWNSRLKDVNLQKFWESKGSKFYNVLQHAGLQNLCKKGKGFKPCLVCRCTYLASD